jgi:hypothetical protein
LEVVVAGTPVGLGRDDGGTDHCECEWEKTHGNSLEGLARGVKRAGRRGRS